MKTISSAAFVVYLSMVLVLLSTTTPVQGNQVKNGWTYKDCVQARIANRNCNSKSNKNACKRKAREECKRNLKAGIWGP